MNFLSIGPMELIFILILALVVFGPRKLPEIGRTIGKGVREFRKVTSELTKDLTVGLEEEAELKIKAEASQGEPNEPVAPKIPRIQPQDEAAPKPLTPST